MGAVTKLTLTVSDADDGGYEVEVVRTSKYTAHLKTEGMEIVGHASDEVKTLIRAAVALVKDE